MTKRPKPTKKKPTAQSPVDVAVLSDFAKSIVFEHRPIPVVVDPKTEWANHLTADEITACETPGTIGHWLLVAWQAHALHGPMLSHVDGKPYPAGWWTTDPDGSPRVIPFNWWLDSLGADFRLHLRKHWGTDWRALEARWHEVEQEEEARIRPSDVDEVARLRSVLYFLTLHDKWRAKWPNPETFIGYIARRDRQHWLRLDSPPADPPGAMIETANPEAPHAAGAPPTQRWADLTFHFDADLSKADVLNRDGRHTGVTVSRDSLNVGPKDWDVLTVLAQGNGDMRTHLRTMEPIPNKTSQAMVRLNKALGTLLGAQGKAIEKGKANFRVQLQADMDQKSELQRLIAEQTRDAREDDSATLAGWQEEADD